MELVCPAGNLPSLKAAVDHGADAVYIGFQGASNARNFPGLNFDLEAARRGLDYCRAAGARLFVAVNVFPTPARWAEACRAVDQAAEIGADAVILADIGLLRYAAARHPELRRHLSVQGSATNLGALNFYAERFGIRRAVLPRVLSLAQVRRIAARAPVEIEVFGYGSLCIMAEGRCTLSSYVTGESPNKDGVCSPAKAVRWVETPQGRRSEVGGVVVDCFAPGEPAGYPTLCKGRYEVGGRVYHALEEPTSLNVLPVLGELALAGVAAVKVEGRQRSPAYVARVAGVLRAALDLCRSDPRRYLPHREWVTALDALSEGRCHTLGAYSRPWQ